MPSYRLATWCIAIEFQGSPPAAFLRFAALGGLRPTGMRHLRINIGVENRIHWAEDCIHSELGGSLTRSILTMALMLLKPYFQGTTKRTGAPFGRAGSYHIHLYLCGQAVQASSQAAGLQIRPGKKWVVSGGQLAWGQKNRFKAHDFGDQRSLQPQKVFY